MIYRKHISVAINLNPKYLHPDLIINHIKEEIQNTVVNNCFNGTGKILNIIKILSIGYGKIHIDTGYSKTPVTFEADVCIPIVDDIITGKIERYDSNGGIYVNYNDIVSIFCLKTNLNFLFDGSLKKDVSKTEITEYEIGKEVSVKITKVNFNEQNMIVIGKILN
jgi:DNA-directed RNA polymerase subunit E'/Rpb7